MLSAHDLPAFTKAEFSGKKTKYCVIIPVINEGERIKTQLIRMKPWLSLYDTIIVDGGSTDDSMNPDYVETTGVRTLIVKTGPGKLSAQMRIGISYALSEGYEGLILIDGNNKDNPEALTAFAEKLDQGFDHIQGSRFVKGGLMINNPASRVWAIRLIHAPLISIAAGFRFTDTTNGFRAYSRRLLMDPRVLPLRPIFTTYELHYYLAIRSGQLKMKNIEIPVERVYPSGGVIPTKIKGFKGNLFVLGVLFKACLGAYDPQKQENSL